MNEPQKTKSDWRIMRRVLVTLAVLATLIAILYTEEDWRGKRAWENYKQEAEAQGQVLDWNQFIPQSVPDDENFYTANTNILLRFKQHNENDPDYKAAWADPWLQLHATASNSYPTLGSPVVAKITVTSAPSISTGEGTNILIVNLNDTVDAARARDLINTVIGPSISGAMGPQFYRRQLKNIHPAQIYVRAEIMPSDSDLRTLIPPDTRLMIVDAVDQKSFEVDLAGSYQMVAADDYLKWSDQFVPAFADIREALKRPYAVLPGDYSKPYQEPIPNFVVMRLLAQTLGQRAQCYFLLGEPDKALDELTLVHDVCRIFQKPPTGQPETLVEAMINVAIHGLYAGVVEQGFQRHAWQEPQLVLLQAQLGQIDLFSPVVNAFSSERAATARVVETTPNMAFKVLQGPNWVFWPLLKSALVPRGWIYQNMVTEDKILREGLDSYDATNEIFNPSIINSAYSQTNVDPHNFIALRYLPNFTRVWQVTAYTQTMINEAQIACALERYHLAHSEYPETLDALVPQFMETVPHDLIGGQPLHYRRTDDGKFLLYSVGWNEIDDGGQSPPYREYPYVSDYSQGDWVWSVTEK